MAQSCITLPDMTRDDVGLLLTAMALGLTSQGRILYRAGDPVWDLSYRRYLESLRGSNDEETVSEALRPLFFKGLRGDYTDPFTPILEAARILGIQPDPAVLRILRP